MIKFLIVVALCSLVQAQQQPRTTPVPILKQVNTHNQDGSYTYGYEGADGSYKIETKAQNGEVKGKYGYYDDVGQLREIEYGASKQGFYPTGNGIKVPEVPYHTSNEAQDNNDGQYIPDDEGKYYPELYEQQEQIQQQQAQPIQPQFQGQRLQGGRRLRVQQQQQQQQFQQQQYQQYEPQIQYQQQPQPQQAPRAHQIITLPANTFTGHPASNIDLNQGSYSINY